MCRGGQQVDILVPHHHQAQYAADKMSLSPLLVLMRFMTWETLRLLFSEIEFRERRRIAEAKSAGGKKGKKGKKAGPPPAAVDPNAPEDPHHPGVWHKSVLAYLLEELLATEAPTDVVGTGPHNMDNPPTRWP